MVSGASDDDPSTVGRIAVHDPRPPSVVALVCLARSGDGADLSVQSSEHERDQN